MLYKVDVKDETGYFESQQKAYEYLLYMTNDIPVLFEIWSSLNLDYQLEQLGLFLTGMSELHLLYQKEYPYFRDTNPPSSSGDGTDQSMTFNDTNHLFERKDGWYPSISYEEFSRRFPDIPYSVLVLMGKRKVSGVGWKVSRN